MSAAATMPALRDASGGTRNLSRGVERLRELDRDADRLHDLLQRMGARGAKRTAPQARVAEMLECSPRHVQDLTLRLNERDIPVASSCIEPMGIFIAESERELAEYGDQLLARLKGNGHRLTCVRRMQRRMALATNMDSTGQRRLWA